MYLRIVLLKVQLIPQIPNSHTGTSMQKKIIMAFGIQKWKKIAVSSVTKLDCIYRAVHIYLVAG